MSGSRGLIAANHERTAWGSRVGSGQRCMRAGSTGAGVCAREAGAATGRPTWHRTLERGLADVAEWATTTSSVLVEEAQAARTWRAGCAGAGDTSR